MYSCVVLPIVLCVVLCCCFVLWCVGVVVVWCCIVSCCVVLRCVALCCVVPCRVVVLFCLVLCRFMPYCVVLLCGVLGGVLLFYHALPWFVYFLNCVCSVLAQSLSCLWSICQFSIYPSWSLVSLRKCEREASAGLSSCSVLWKRGHFLRQCCCHLRERLNSHLGIRVSVSVRVRNRGLLTYCQ
jgi:hypothetical protein